MASVLPGNPESDWTLFRAKFDEVVGIARSAMTDAADWRRLAERAVECGGGLEAEVLRLRAELADAKQVAKYESDVAGDAINELNRLRSPSGTGSATGACVMCAACGHPSHAWDCYDCMRARVGASPCVNVGRSPEVEEAGEAPGITDRAPEADWFPRYPEDKTNG